MKIEFTKNTTADYVDKYAIHGDCYFPKGKVLNDVTIAGDDGKWVTLSNNQNNDLYLDIPRENFKILQ